MTFVSSCKKEKPNLENGNNTSLQPEFEYNEELDYTINPFQNPYIPDISQCNVGIAVVNGYLKFNSIEDFNNTVDCLEAKSELMDDDFLSDWGHLNDSLLNIKEMELNYHEESVYYVFEQQHNIGYSLRKLLNDEEEAWLDNDILDTINIPEDHAISELAVQSVFSSTGVVIIEDTIMLMKPNGLYYRILNGSFSTLDSILNNTWVEGNPFVEINEIDGTRRSSCKRCKRSKPEIISNGNYRMKYSAGFCSTWIRRWMRATTTAYKKRNNKWKKYRTSIQTSFASSFEPSTYCSSPTVTSRCNINFNSKRNKKYKCKNIDWGVSARWQSGNHIGNHRVPVVSNTTYVSIVTW